MSETLHIRPIRPNELETLLDLYTHHLFDEPDVPRPPDESVFSVWNAITTDPKVQVFAAEMEGRLVSSATLVIVPNLTRGCRPYGVVENVVTHKQFRRRGAASVLLREVLRIAWDNGCYKVMLLSSPHRTEAHGLYEKSGFSRTSKLGFAAYKIVFEE